MVSRREFLKMAAALAAAFGLAAAIEISGLGNRLADSIVDLAAPFGQVAILAAIVLATITLKEVITNKGSVLLLTPIAFSVAAATGAHFIRVNVLSGMMSTDQGPIVGKAAEVGQLVIVHVDPDDEERPGV